MFRVDLLAGMMFQNDYIWCHYVKGARLKPDSFRFLLSGVRC